MPYELLLRAEDDEPVYIRSLAARLARIPLDFLVLCEREGLVESKVMTGGGTGFTIHNIQQLTVIRRLHQELDLDIETIDLVLHMRRQIIDLQNRLRQAERQSRHREQKLLAELQDLRRVMEEREKKLRGK
jgi:DNA-binding transcriptional MerR regulator